MSDSAVQAAPWRPPRGWKPKLQQAGTSWDAVRVPADVAERTLVLLGDLTGAVIEDQFGAVAYWLVHPGSADNWRLEQVRVLGTSSVVVVPPQGRIDGPGLRWRVRLSPACYLTPAQILHDALRSAGAETRESVR